MMNINQTKLVGLTMKLELKTKEFKKLCETLDKLKENQTDPNDEAFLKLKKQFQENQNEIIEIKKQLNEIK